LNKNSPNIIEKIGWKIHLDCRNIEGRNIGEFQLWQVGGFYMGIAISSTNKADRHDTAEILWKCALSTLTLTLLFVRIDMNHIYAIYV